VNLDAIEPPVHRSYEMPAISQQESLKYSPKHQSNVKKKMMSQWWLHGR